MKSCLACAVTLLSAVITLAAEPNEPSEPLAVLSEDGGVVDVSADGQWLAIGADIEGPLKMFHLPSKKEVATLEDVGGTYISLDLSADGKLLAAVRVSLEPAENNLSVWDVPGRKRLWQSKEGAHWARFAPDGKTLATGQHVVIRFQNAVTGSVAGELPAHPESNVELAEYTRTGKGLVTAGDEDRKVLLWATATGKGEKAFQLAGEKLSELAISEDGSLIAAAQLGHLTVLDAKTGRPRWSKQVHEETIMGLDFRPKSTQLASGSHDGTVRIWDAGSGEELQALTPEQGMVQSVKYTPDGSRLLVGTASAVLLFAAPTGGGAAEAATTASAPGAELAGGAPTGEETGVAAAEETTASDAAERETTASEAAPPAAAPKRTLSSEVRTWRSASGKFSVQARFAGRLGDQVRLVREDNGKTISVPLKQLSPEDQALITRPMP